MNTQTRELTVDELDAVSGGDDALQKLVIGGILLYEADKNSDLLANAIKKVASKY